MSKQIEQVWMGAVDNTALGTIWTAVSDQGLVAVSLWGDQARFEAEVEKLTGCVPVLAEERVTAVTTQLRQYLNQEREAFNLPIDWSVMTPFQEAALRLVYAVPYGRLTTYGKIAKQLDKPGASRAVGRANAANPMPLVIPCHRVLGRDGKLHGFSAPGGLETKAWLLRMEGSWLI